MVLEQFNAWVDGVDQASLGPTVVVGPDQFQMLSSSDLKLEHGLISEYLAECTGEMRFGAHRKAIDGPAFAKMKLLNRLSSNKLVLALIERIFWAGAFPPHEYDVNRVDVEHGVLDPVLAEVVANANFALIRGPLLKLVAHDGSHNCLMLTVAALLQRLDKAADPQEQRWIERIYASMIDSPQTPQTQVAAKRATELLAANGWHDVLVPSEPWARTAAAELQVETQPVQSAWRDLLTHCATAKSANPSAKWLKGAAEFLAVVGHESFREALLRWFPLVDKPEDLLVIKAGWGQADPAQRINVRNADVLRGLLWICPLVDSPELQRAITALALSAYRKIPGLGPRAVKVGNAALSAFGAIGTVEAVGQLAVLKVRVKFGSAQKLIEKALNAAAAKVGIPREDLEEMAVPAYGLTEVGVRTEALGDFTARVVIDGKRAKLAWLKPDGKQQSSIPKQVKDNFGEELKDLKAAVKDIEKMLPAQAARIELLWLAQKSWPLAVWRERYLDHPLVGVLARRLIWVIDNESVIAPNGEFERVDGQRLSPAADAKVTLWHPLERPESEVLAWREWLQTREVRQPFKQAHREIYRLTDAERRTRTYSNRFAGHVVKQHQFNSLAAARGWKHPLRLMVDAEYPPAHFAATAFGYRVEYWVEGIGDDYGVDTNESGSYLRLVTDQVRFYRLAAPVNQAHAAGGGYEMRAPDEGENHPVPLEEIPPLLLSEALRDVDLFVGVASIGNDPTWSDGGPEGRYREYWSSVAFGDLSATAQTRKGILERLLPRLKIAKLCELEDRWLRVRGTYRTYKIHLGSGNIMMEPNDQYLCIVKAQSTGAKADSLFLPFDGDSMLSVILSKAFLLADDRSIKDSTILSQIQSTR